MEGSLAVGSLVVGILVVGILVEGIPVEGILVVGILVVDNHVVVEDMLQVQEGMLQGTDLLEDIHGRHDHSVRHEPAVRTTLCQIHRAYLFHPP